MYAHVILILLPFLLREYAHWRSTKHRPAGTRLGGFSSAIVWNVAYPLLFVLALYSGATTPLVALDWLGYGMLWLGALLRVTAFRELKSCYYILVVVQPQHRVIETGPYRYLRHPLHLGLLLEMLGLALLAPSWLTGALFVVSLLTLLHRNWLEEQLLEIHLGEAYRVYRKNAWDLLDLVPWVGAPATQRESGR